LSGMSDMLLTCYGDVDNKLATSETGCGECMANWSLRIWHYPTKSLAA